MATSPPERATHRERKRLATTARIRDCAFDLFERQGYGETTVEEIAEAAMVAPRTFFRYFPTKASVVFDVNAEWFEVYRSNDPLQPGESVIDGIRRITLAIVVYIEENPEPALRTLRMARLSDELLHAGLMWDLQWRIGVAEFVMERFENPSDAMILGGVTMSVISGTLNSWAGGDASRSLAEMMLQALEQIENGFQLGPS